jgi:hypothetical protein
MTVFEFLVAWFSLWAIAMISLVAGSSHERSADE